VAGDFAGNGSVNVSEMGGTSPAVPGAAAQDAGAAFFGDSGTDSGINAETVSQ